MSTAFNILEHGAVGNSGTVSTKAIQAAVDRCSESGGGRVLIPPGTFLTGTVWLKDNVELYLSPGAVLKGSPDLADYNADDCIPQNVAFSRERVTGGHLIIAAEVKNVSISGPGTIDGNAFAFFDGFSTPKPDSGLDCWGEGRALIKETLRPGQMLFFCECEHVRIENVTLQNSPYWTCFLHGCEDVLVQGVRIHNDRRSINSDGIDIDCCRNVVVANCIIITADDAITLRSYGYPLKNKERNCENIAISNCVLSSQADALRLGVGNNAIRNVVISNIMGEKVSRGLCIQPKYSQKHPGGDISSIRMENLHFTQCKTPFFIDPGLDGSARIENIYITGFSADSIKTASLFGNGRSKPKNIRFKDVELCITGRLPAEDHHNINPETYREWDKGLDCAVLISGTEDVFLDDFRIRWMNTDGGWKHGLVSEKNTGLKISGTCVLPEPEQTE